MLKQENVILNNIEKIIETLKKEIALKLNEEMLNIYWNIGRIIVENEQKGNLKAEYGKETLKIISDKLTFKYGRGNSISNLKQMRAFYLSGPIRQTYGFLTRSHYLLVLSLNEKRKRGFMPKHFLIRSK